MTHIELYKLALDALEPGLDCARDKAEDIHESYKGYYPERHARADKNVAEIEAAIAALQAALAEPSAEPVAYLHKHYGHLQDARGLSQAQYDEYKNGQWVPLFTHPPVPESLTVVEIMREWSSAKDSVVDFARAIEAAIRSKSLTGTSQ
jgi:hypothetical protein